MSREKVLSVSIKDCEVQTFRAGGNGGQNQNKRDTGVRVIHHPSGARGESREERSQLKNKRTAFRRMAESPEFQRFCQDAANPEAVEERERAQARFGSKVRRTYVLHGREMVKDPTTGHRTHDAQRVLDGDLDDFLRASLKHQAETEAS